MGDLIRKVDYGNNREGIDHQYEEPTEKIGDEINHK